MAVKRVTISARVNKQITDFLELEANRLGISRTKLIRRIMKNWYIKKHQN